MSNKHIIKKSLILIIATLCFCININQVLAGYDWNVPNNNSDGTGGSGDDSSTGGGGNAGPPTYGSSCISYSCKVSVSDVSKGSVNADIKNMNGELITGDIFDNTLSKEFLAGTYISLRVYEHQEFTSTASYSVSAKRQVWTCNYYNYEPYPCCIETYLNGTCKKEGTCQQLKLSSTTEEKCTCAGSADFVSSVWKGWEDVTSDYIDQCAATAIPNKRTLAPSFIAQYEDSNDINNEKNPSTKKEINGELCSEGNTNPGTGGYSNGVYQNSNVYMASCDIEYDRESKICINVKTGMIEYKDDGGECDKEYEITKDKDGYWKYFIPLNANSKNDFIFSLNSNGDGKKEKEICEYLIDNYPTTYQYKITDQNEQSFIGTNLSLEEAKSRVANGCYLKTIAVIPIKQRFYNELEDGKTFQGFNFYYKSIDINDPFPNNSATNPLPTYSLWYDWSQSATKAPDITKSYDKKTYIAYTSGNEDEIRKKTKENPYTSWGNMELDGYSEFIKDVGGDVLVGRTSDAGKVYRLGCGPTNTVTDVNNIFYQKECVE